MSNTAFQALVVSENAGKYNREIKTLIIDDLPESDVLIRVHYSSLNYKDALSASGNRAVTRRYPHTPGIDAAGVVVQSEVSEFVPGDRVIASGFDLGMNTPGGFGGYIRVPASWVIALPNSMSLERSMGFGTAGFTAAQCVDTLVNAGVRTHAGPVLVTGATGGVGSIAVALLGKCGFDVTAVTGKLEAEPFLKKLGAKTIITRKTATGRISQMMLKEKWAGVVDTVGGDILAGSIKSTKYGGVVTCCGNAASPDLPLSVYPFILRGVSLIGIDSAKTPKDIRQRIWKKLAGDWQVDQLDDLTTTIPLHSVDPAIDKILRGRMKGRTVISL